MLKCLHDNQMVIIFEVSIINNSMDNEKRKELLKDIQMMKMEAKSELQKVSFLLKEGKIYNKAMDVLLDRLRMLEELEKEIRKMD